MMLIAHANDYAEYDPQNVFNKDHFGKATASFLKKPSSAARVGGDSPAK